MDPSLHAAAIGKNAHMRVQTGAAGDLTMRLRVSDGVADLEVGGAAVGALGMRPQELRRALAGEGLTLGQFISRPADGSSEGRPAAADSWGASANGPAGAQPSAPGSGAAAQLPASAAGAPGAQGGSFSFNQGRRQWHGEAPDGTDAAHPPSTAGGVGHSAESSSGPEARVRRRGFHVTA
jgi:hypothetical protein